MIRATLSAAALLALAGCSSFQQATSVAQQAQPALTTLADLAAANNSTVATLIAKGQLFCQSKVSGAVQAVSMVAPVVGAAGALVPGAGAAIGVAATVIGATAADVAQACAALNAIPVPAPTTTPTASTPVATVALPSGSTVKPAS